MAGNQTSGMVVGEGSTAYHHFLPFKPVKTKICFSAVFKNRAEKHELVAL
jgi:hypothetical protein